MSHSMTTELEEAQQAYREAARDFAQAELAPHAARWDAEGIFPREAIAKAGELGFCGLYMDPEVGGSGLSRLDAAVVIEELANVDPSTAAYISIHNMASWMVSKWGQPALRDAWGADLSSGSKLASYCLTEPGAGSDAASTSPVVANGTLASTSWVAGLITSCQWEVADSTNWPSISMRIRGAATVMTTIPRGAKDAWHYSHHPSRFPG